MDDAVVAIIIIVLGYAFFGLIAGLIGVGIMESRWSLMPEPILDYRKWKCARLAREQNSPEDFVRYKELCEIEHRYANNLIKSWLHTLSFVFWPVTLVLGAAYMIVWLPMKLIKPLLDIPKIIDSARGH